MATSGTAIRGSATGSPRGPASAAPKGDKPTPEQAHAPRSSPPADKPAEPTAPKTRQVHKGEFVVEALGDDQLHRRVEDQPKHKDTASAERWMTTVFKVAGHYRIIDIKRELTLEAAPVATPKFIIKK